jgi:hypothetical protein
MMAKLRKKLVKAKRFWKINAIRPEIKARRGGTRNLKLGAESKLGRIGEGVRLPNRNPEHGFVRWVNLPKTTTQIGVEWRTYNRPFTARFLFRKLLHFA